MGVLDQKEGRPHPIFASAWLFCFLGIGIASTAASAAHLSEGMIEDRLEHSFQVEADAVGIALLSLIHERHSWPGPLSC